MNPRNIILVILKLRKYIVNEEEFLNSIEEEYFTHKENDENDKIYVFFPKSSTKIGVFIIRQYIKEMKDNEVKNAIIVVKDSITAFAKQVFIEEKTLNIECFKESDLLINKLDHVLVPKHELLSDEEKKELMKIYKLKEGQLPNILSSDPIARYFGAKKGQVFKITRISETCGNSIYYRIVID